MSLSSHHRVVQLLALALTAACSGASGAQTVTETATTTAQKHAIALTRTAIVGQTMHVSAEGSQEAETLPYVGGRRQQPQSKTVHVILEADAEVMKVDGDDQPTEIAYRIKRCERTLNGHKRTIAREGALLVAERRADDKTYFTLEGRSLDAEASECLRIVARFDEEGMTHDKLAGNPEPKAAGESWSVDLDAVTAVIQADADHVISADDVSGTVTFWEPTDHAGHPCLLIDTELSVRNWLSEIPDGFTLESGMFSAIIRGLYPTDLSLPTLAVSQSLEIEAKLVGSPFPGQPEMALNIVMKQRVEREVTPLAPDAVAVVE